MVKRHLLFSLKEAMQNQSVIALLGPRQVGKTTLALSIAKTCPSLYLDLESPADLARLENPLMFLSQNKDKLIILDEIHRKPDLFMILRGLVDEGRRAGKKGAQFLILGSAGVDLLKQSSESLAGRISYFEMTGFNLMELPVQNKQKLWVRGGFPESYLAKNDRVSYDWRGDFIRTYIERDIPQWVRVPSERIRRLWTMLAYLQGQTLNFSSLAGNMDMSAKTIKYYVDILTELLLLRCLKPYRTNIRKRLIKAPRVYIRDSGLVHNLLGIHDGHQLLSHPVVGASWEAFVIENIISVLPRGAELFFYRTLAGAEIDLIIAFGRHIWAVEIKKGLAPKIPRGFYQAVEDIQATEAYIVYSGEEEFYSRQGAKILSLSKLMQSAQKLFSS